MAAAVLLLPALAAGTARAQRPVARAGYGGWNGWGGGATTAQGSAARGAGVMAAGAGAYNQQTAEARSMNANTAMQMNEYLYQSQQRRNQTYYANQAAQRERTIESADTVYKRLHDNPEPRDIRDGDALNVVLDDLTNPAIYGKSLQAATAPVPSALVKEITFEYAANAIAISLDDVSARGCPDVLLTSPDFATERQNIRGIVTQARQESASQGQVKPETLANLRVAIKAAQDKVARVIPDGTPQRRDCDNFLKGLYGLTRMLQTPDVAGFLKGLNAVPTVTLGEVLSFMHSFNLRFGVPKSPQGETVYDQLYPMLVALRDAVQAPSMPPSMATATPPDPRKATAYFSGMSYDQVAPPPPPAANPPR
jgi:hypothetical protein